MEDQHQPNEPTDKKAVVENSIKKLKEKFVPTVKYTLLISAIFSLAMLVVGCLNVHNCPVNKNIPLFLIATGAIGLMSKFVTYVRQRISKHVQVVYFESALYSLETMFFLLGTYWVYKEFKPSYDPQDGGLYCDKTAYIFAFTYVTIFYAVIVAMICGFCCFVCCALCLLQVAVRTGDGGGGSVEAPTNNTDATVALTTPTKDTVEVKL